MQHKIPLLEQQITNLEKINTNWQQTDSLRCVQLNEQLANNKKLVKTNKILTISTIVALILCLLK